MQKLKLFKSELDFQFNEHNLSNIMYSFHVDEQPYILTKDSLILGEYEVTIPDEKLEWTDGEILISSFENHLVKLYELNLVKDVIEVNLIKEIEFLKPINKVVLVKNLLYIFSIYLNRYELSIIDIKNNTSITLNIESPDHIMLHQCESLIIINEHIFIQLYNNLTIIINPKRQIVVKEYSSVTREGGKLYYQDGKYLVEYFSNKVIKYKGDILIGDGVIVIFRKENIKIIRDSEIQYVNFQDPRFFYFPLKISPTQTKVLYLTYISDFSDEGYYEYGVLDLNTLQFKTKIFNGDHDGIIEFGFVNMVSED
jgi:hypothetical protein